MKKEIVILNEESITEGYGIASYLKQYISCLKYYELTIHIINFNARCNGVEFKTEDDIQIYDIPRSTFEINSSSYYLSVVQIFKILHPDKDFIFHLHYELTEPLVDAIRKYFSNSTIIYTLHYAGWSWKLNGDIDLYREIIKKTDGIYNDEKYSEVVDYYDSLKRFYNKLDIIIVLCQDSYSLLTEIYKIAPNKIRLIPNGMTDVYSPNDNLDNISPENEFTLLYVGRLDDKKGLIQLLCAFDKILKIHQHTRLFIVGNGHYDDFLPYCKSNWSSISFCGRIDSNELYKLYRKSDIGIISSFSEQSSYVGIEMKMFGLPIVASDGYGVRDMFNDSNSLIAPLTFSNNFEQYITALSNSILCLLKDETLRHKLSTKSRKDFLENYHIDLMTEKYRFLSEV